MPQLPAPLPASSVRELARGRDWRISDVVCRRGPADRRFEEQHAGVSLAVVLRGSFHYRSRAGEALLYPGAVLLGEAGTCFECGHEHGTGDHCLSFGLAPDLFEELARAVTDDQRFRIGTPMLPAVRSLLAPLQQVQSRLRTASLAGLDEAVMQFAEAVVQALVGTSPRPAAPAPRDQRRLGAVVREIESHPQRAHDLDGLAALACMSKYHFLRCFRRILGVPPHQYLIQQRLHLAARQLLATPIPIAQVALDAGFGDLSTFNAGFRQAFGITPLAFRRRG